MAWFLHSRLVTHVCVLVLVALAGLATFYYAWSFSRKWPNPTTTTGVIKGFAMTFHALFGFCSLLTWHSIRISSQSIMFGTWTTFGFAGIVFDSWWFGLMVARKGFDLLESSRKGVTVAFCVYSGFYAVYRLVVMLFVFHFDVRYNEGLATAMGTVAAAPAPTGVPSVVHIAGPPVAHPGAYQYPLSQQTVTTLRSLAKRLSIQRGSRRPFARLEQHDGAVHEAAPGNRGDVSDPRWGSPWTKVRKWWPGSRRALPAVDQSVNVGSTSGQVPLIRVSVHQDSLASMHQRSDDEALDHDDPVLFDATSVRGSSLDSYDLVEPRSLPVQSPRGTLNSSSGFSSGDEEDEQEAQRAYEERRRRRRQGKDAA
ncbi:hypothetical protein JCM3774_000653 [Rhodotorula dairenensis]